MIYCHWYGLMIIILNQMKKELLVKKKSELNIDAMKILRSTEIFCF